MFVNEIPETIITAKFLLYNVVVKKRDLVSFSKNWVF